MKVRIGSRGSRLALWQAEHIQARLRELQPGLEVELVIIKTRGDQILDRPLADVGGKGLFVKEIEEALLAGEIDLAVHSLKDMPTDQPDGLVLAAFPERAQPFDVFCPTVPGTTFESLPKGARIGTSSLRRASQVLNARPDIEIVSIRGNVETRLRKRYDAELGLAGVLLAEAGLKRLGIWEDAFEVLVPPLFFPAPAQGVLAIETRTDAGAVGDLVAQLDHAETRLAVLAERSCLAQIGGDCRTPFAAWARLDQGHLTLSARLLEPDGRATDGRQLASIGDDANAAAVELGRSLALQLLERHNAPARD
jgi:hydroxymethylbilane synthase